MDAWRVSASAGQDFLCERQKGRAAPYQDAGALRFCHGDTGSAAPPGRVPRASLCLRPVSVPGDKAGRIGPIWDLHALRLDFGRPASIMRLRTATPMAASTYWPGNLRACRWSPRMRLYLAIALFHFDPLVAVDLLPPSQVPLSAMVWIRS